MPLRSLRGFAETKGQVSSQVADDQEPIKGGRQQIRTNVRTQSLQKFTITLKLRAFFDVKKLP